MITDLTNVPKALDEKLNTMDLNRLSTVATLGFGDIPPLAFAKAYNYISNQGWIAFNIRDLF